MGIYRERKTGPSFFGQVAKEGKGGEASGLFGGSPKKCRLVNNIREAEGRGRSYLRPREESWPSPVFEHFWPLPPFPWPWGFGRYRQAAFVSYRTKMDV